MKDLQRSTTRPAKDANPLMRQIRTLENRLDKAMIKYNEAQSIRKTYDQIVKRLKDERVTFDNQLAAIETTLEAKQRDVEELLLMSHDASHARDVAKGELAKLLSMQDAERKAREKELAERRNAVQARQELNRRMEERERARRDVVLESKGDLGEASEHALKQNVAKNALHHSLNSNTAQSEHAVVGAYESAFRRIKEATGVSDVNEVIQKFMTQEQTHASLKQLTKDAQARIEALAGERVSTKLAVDEMKYAGGAGPGSRQEVEGAERKHQEVSQALERVKVRYLRTTKIFVDVRVGIEHMADKLEPIRGDAPSVAISDDTIVDVMQQCEAKLVKLAEAYAAASNDGSGRGLAPAPPDVSQFSESASGYNIRVHLPEEEFEEDEEDEEDGFEADIPDRKQMKKLNGIMLDKATKKVTKRRNGGTTGKPGGRSELA